jgi:hypothetical protein
MVHARQPAADGARVLQQGSNLQSSRDNRESFRVLRPDRAKVSLVERRDHFELAPLGRGNNRRVHHPQWQVFPASSTCPGYENETWNTYVTETFNPLSHHPLFWSATLNDPAQPVWYGLGTAQGGVARAPAGLRSSITRIISG